MEKEELIFNSFGTENIDVKPTDVASSSKDNVDEVENKEEFNAENSNDDEVIWLYHFEDEGPWQTLLKRIAEKIGFRYREFEALNEEELSFLDSIRGPGIVVFDLALPDNADTDDSISKIYEIAHDLLQKNIQIFVLSAFSKGKYYIDDQGQIQDIRLRYIDLLTDAGIEVSRMFLKDDFSGKDLESILNVTYQQLSRKRTSRPPRMKVGEIKVSFTGATISDEGAIFRLGQEYKLQLELNNRLKEVQSNDIIGRHIRVNVQNPTANIFPSTRILTVPYPNKNSKAGFTISFNKSVPGQYEEIEILLYHNNHLMKRIIEIVKIVA